MDAPLIEALASLGAGGIMAGGMFWFYRTDSQEARKRLEALLADYHVLLGRVLTHFEAAEPPAKK